MSNAGDFLSIPKQQAFFTAIKNGRSAEGSCTSPVEDEDEEEVEETSGLMPRSSPVPRKRGLSILDEAAEYMKTRLALAGRRVSFADASGGELVQVKEFLAFESDEDEEQEAAGHGGLPAMEPLYSVRPDFPSPSQAELLLAVRTNKVEVEKVSSTEGEPLAFTGLVRVLNISFQKAVYVRFTMDGWASFFDCPAEYLHGSNDVETDRFTFKLSFAPPYLHDGARMEFVVRYEAGEGAHWANNAGKNYSVVLNATRRAESTRGREAGREVMRGILKAPSYRMETDYMEAPVVEKDGGDVRDREPHTNVLPQIIQPEIDVENIAAVISSPPSKSDRDLESEERPLSSIESFQEHPPLFPTAIEEPTPLTNQPPIPCPEVESHQKPDLEKESFTSIGNSDNAVSTSDVSSRSPYDIKITPGSHGEELNKSRITHSVSTLSSQATKYDPETSDDNKAAIRQDEIQHKSLVSHSLDALDCTTDSQILDRKRISEGKDHSAIAIQEQQTIAPSVFGSAQEDEDKVEFRQEVGSWDSGQISFFCLTEEPKKYITSEEEIMQVSEARLNVENDPAIREQHETATLNMMHMTSGACFGADGRRIQCHAISDTGHTIPTGHVTEDLERKMDEPTGVYKTDLNSPRPLAEAHDVTSYKLLPCVAGEVVGSAVITSEIADSQEATGEVARSPVIKDEVTVSQDGTAEGAGSAGSRGEVRVSQDGTGEVAGSAGSRGEVRVSQDGTGEVAGSTGSRGEVRVSQDGTGEVAGSTGSRMEVAGLLTTTAIVLPSEPTASGLVLSTDKNDIPVQGEIFIHDLETKLISPQSTDGLEKEELSLSQQIALDSLVSEVTYQALAKAFLTFLIVVCLVMVITYPHTLFIISLFCCISSNSKLI